MRVRSNNTGSAQCVRAEQVRVGPVVCRHGSSARLGVRASAGPLNQWFSSFVNNGNNATASAPVADAPSPPQAPERISPRDYLEARQMSIYQLLDSDEMKFDIPVYQRPYSWHTKQVYEMLQDFYKAYASGQEYFIGAIVTTRADARPSAPYQIIDGQQRLTTVFIMLSCLHTWAKETGNTTLTTRVWRMLHLDADPLVNNSSARFRLRLRDVDDAFWRANIMEELLPASFHFTGLAAADAHAAGDGGDGTTPEGALPLEAEAQWRLYNNASFMRAHLERLCAQDGFNLQDFMFHVLRNCYVVMMTARDEASSFNIFSTLNSRGMDLSEVDKLKADLLQVLEPAERAQCNSQWSEMENLLGCREFHRVFDHMKALAGVLEPVRTQSVLEYFTQDLSSPNTVTQIIKVALDYSRILLQLRTGRWDSALSPSGSTLSPPPPGSEALLSRLSAQSAVMNMFEDEAWVPTALEFFLQASST
ncbi:hypothetical protein FOA52_004958 [Chlamydomonas sp. UWO 241]|nr:hypothetical protein FOA52_004958 [Chlamydomonas sp. UWO 241]